jgi:hypothetical protein
MSTPEVIIVSCLAILGVAHSALGERNILRPLFAQDWKVSMPRWVIEKILRFAWHLTSIAWVALAAIIAGVNALPVIGAMSLISGAIIFVVLRGHLAWPLFLLAGLAAFYAEGWIDSSLLRVGVGATTVALVAASLIHVHWAMGGTWMIDRASPEIEGSDFSPGPILTLAVAAALAVFAGLVTVAGFGDRSSIIRWLVIGGIAVLTIRAIGDNKVAGFTKTVRHTTFAKADDRYFTPLIVFLALGATGALL